MARAVVETAQDEQGRYWAYATLNDAFTLRRACRHEDAIFGLGEKTGHQNRKGRDFTLWNNDVLNPDSAREITAGLPEGDPRADRTSTGVRPLLRLDPVLLPPGLPGGGHGGLLPRQRLPRQLRVLATSEEYRVHFAGGQYTEYIFAGPGMPEILTAYTGLTGRTAPPPLWSLGYHQCRWFDYTQDAVEGLAQRHRDEGIPCDALWLDIDYMDGYRVFTWNTDSFPDAPGMLKRLSEKGFRTITIIDPGVKHEPGYGVFDQAVERDVLCRTEGGDIYIGQVWPGNTAFPDFATQEARGVVGRAQRRARRVGARRHLERHERARDGNIDPRVDALQPGTRLP